MRRTAASFLIVALSAATCLVSCSPDNGAKPLSRLGKREEVCQYMRAGDWPVAPSQWTSGEALVTAFRRLNESLTEDKLGHPPTNAEFMENYQARWCLHRELAARWPQLLTDEDRAALRNIERDLPALEDNEVP